MSALLVLLVLQSAPSATETSAVATGPSSRKVGVHLGLNATAAIDAEFGDLLYGEFATQLTGLGNVVDPDRGLVLSAFVMGGVTLPLANNPGHRLQFDVGPHLTILRSAPTNILAGGIAAGLRLVYANGLTFGLKLPVVGYAGSVNEPRGGLLYYYVAAVPTFPVLTAGYSF